MTKKNIPDDSLDVLAKTQSLNVVRDDSSNKYQNINLSSTQHIDFSKLSINPFSILLESRFDLSVLDKFDQSLEAKQISFAAQDSLDDVASESLQNKQIITMINQALQFIKTKE